MTCDLIVIIWYLRLIIYIWAEKIKPWKNMYLILGFFFRVILELHGYKSKLTLVHLVFWESSNTNADHLQGLWSDLHFVNNFWIFHAIVFRNISMIQSLTQLRGLAGILKGLRNKNYNLEQTRRIEVLTSYDLPYISSAASATRQDLGTAVSKWIWRPECRARRWINFISSDTERRMKFFVCFRFIFLRNCLF